MKNNPNFSERLKELMTTAETSSPKDWELKSEYPVNRSAGGARARRASRFPIC